MQIPTKEAFSPYVDCPRRTPPVRSMKDNYPSVHIENLTRLSSVLLYLLQYSSGRATPITHIFLTIFRSVGS